ncbi:MAG: glycine--tRNA ligase subunit beta [Burkholderiaceae bacterium]
MSSALLIELFTEELPPKALRQLGQSFAQTLSGHLVKVGLAPADAPVESFASPRRLAVRIQGVGSKADDRPKREKLLPVSVALDSQGGPQPPLLKKLNALGFTLGENIQLSDLIREGEGPQATLFIDTVVPGASLAIGAQEALELAIAKLPIPKVMRYQKRTASGEVTEVKFVRPAHRLLALHGEHVLPLHALGLQADRLTQGHRFHCEAPISIPTADDYETLLERQGHVVAGFDTRRERLEQGLRAAAGDHQVVMPDTLLDEVNSLVEWPVVLAGSFDPAFLEVPQACLILTMQQNQKYFALTDTEGHLVNRFLLAANLESKHPQAVVHGNERVLRARLSDAKFFFDQDRKRRLEDRLPALAQVVYHNKIGSQAERIARLEALARGLAPLVGANPDAAGRAARLAKADLVSDMVGEFPELQGLVGRTLAQHEREADDIAWAIEDHYRPKFAGDELPRSAVGLAVSLADKLESLVGIWGIGLVPTGDKDPFALRRSALGVIRMLIERTIPASLSQLVEATVASFSQVSNVQLPKKDLLGFIHDRARGYLRDQGFEQEAIEAVLAECPDRLDQLIPRLQAVRSFMGSDQAAALCAANKRIGNILKKSEPSALGEVNTSLLQEPAEQALSSALLAAAPQAMQFAQKGEYEASMRALASLRGPVDAFFESVMVNADDPALRNNRLSLLHALHRAMNQVADLSRLAT